MDSTAPTRTKPAAAATPHPFNGDFRSIRINNNHDEDDDGVIHLDITPGGFFNSGTYTPAGGASVRLTRDILNRQEIKVTAPDGRFWNGKIESLVNDPQNPQFKVIVGRYHIPAIAADKKLGIAARAQDNGTWVATQP